MYDPLSDAIVYRHMIQINDGLRFHHNVILNPVLALFHEGKLIFAGFNVLRKGSPQTGGLIKRIWFLLETV